MKIRTDFVTNSSSSSYTVDLYGIDADNHVCYRPERSGYIDRMLNAVSDEEEETSFKTLLPVLQSLSRPDLSEKGLDQMVDLVVVWSKSGYGETEIGYDDEGNEDFTELRDRFSEADDEERELIVDEAVQFFYGFPEWLANTENSEDGRLYLWELEYDGSSSDRDLCREYLEEGFEDDSVEYCTVALIDPVTLEIVREIDVLSESGFNDKKLENLLKKLRV